MDEELAPHRKLARIEDRTNEDGSINVEISDWWITDDEQHVVVEFITPVQDVEQEKMSFPEAGDVLYDSKFYRLVHSCGYSLREAERLDGETVKARRCSNGTWTLDVGEIDNRSNTDRARDGIQWIVTQPARLLTFLLNNPVTTIYISSVIVLATAMVLVGLAVV